MLRLHSSILTHLLSPCSVAIPTRFSLHRLLSATAAPHISRNPSFAVGDYLVDTCGLTRHQALKASAKLSHLKSPTNPDAVMAFLAGLSLSSADVASLVAKDPMFLCTSVDTTLAANLAGLTGLGLSHTEIARLATLAPVSFRHRSIVSNLPYYMLLYGSYENHIRTIKRCLNLLTHDVEGVVKPNIEFLREWGLGTCDIKKLCIAQPWLVTANLKRVQATVACAESLGVPRGSLMLKHALQAVAFVSEEKITVKMDYLKKALRWSDTEVGIAVCRAPMLLRKSKDTLQKKSEFLFSEVRLEPAYIAHRPVMLMYSLEGRMKPRYYVVKFLKEKGLLQQDRDYYVALSISEKVFMEKFICPHKWHHTWPKTMRQPAEGKWRLDSNLHEPRRCMKVGTVDILCTSNWEPS